MEFVLRVEIVEFASSTHTTISRSSFPDLLESNS